MGCVEIRFAARPGFHPTIVPDQELRCWRFSDIRVETRLASGSQTDETVTMNPSDDVAVSVLRSNQRFYDAHEGRDIAAMRAVWEQSDRATCVHPGWPILRGWSAVENSWTRILAGPGHNQFILTNESVTIEGPLAWVTLDENLVSESGTGTVAATNLFARHGADWLLVVHHGSPVMS